MGLKKLNDSILGRFTEEIILPSLREDLENFFSAILTLLESKQYY
jgi:hypothetical protein